MGRGGGIMYTLEIRVDNLQSLEQGNLILDAALKLAEQYGAMASGGVSEAVSWETERAAILDALELVEQH